MTILRGVDIVKAKPFVEKPKKSLKSKINAAMHELSTLYSKSFIRNRLIICQFSWFVVSFAYYAIALNAENISADPYTYILIMGLFELPSCFLTIVFLKYFGRKSTTLMLLTMSGLSLLSLLRLSQGKLFSQSLKI